MADDRKTKPTGQDKPLTAWERWELPLLDGQGNEIPQMPEEAEVKPLTAAELEAIRDAAVQEGREEGYQAGFAQGQEEGQKQGYEVGYQAGEEQGRRQGEQLAAEQTRSQVDASLERLEALMAELVDPIHRHDDELETALVNLTTTLARAVVYRELRMDSSQIQGVVRQALALLPATQDNVRIHVNPADVPMVQDVASRLEAETVVLEDPDILAGGCKVETRHSLVDFTVEKRFQKAVQSMLDKQLTSDEPGDAVELDAMMGDLTDFHRDVLESDASNTDPGDDDHEKHPE
ncbi:MAG: flagellar assembly protein FliH [Marinobacter sp.]|nr:flagellar assembly protein FliH [Marinobacter sp.]